MTQLHFDLPPRVSLGAEDYFVSDANRSAFEQVIGQADWPGGRLVLVGPERSGKTHLARIWAQAQAAVLIDATALDPNDALPHDGSDVVVDDADRVARGSEEALFHLYNHVGATGGQLLLTARTAPARWGIALPDLASRVQSCVVARIDDPDDDLLRAVLLKQFSDRQLAPAPGLVDWLVPRMERSFEAAAALVGELDRRSLAQSSDINRTLARAILDKPPEHGE